MRLHTALVAVALCIGLSAVGQNKFQTSVKTIPQNSAGEFSVFASITKYLTLGDAASLSSWFADNLDVTVISSTRNCSRTVPDPYAGVLSSFCKHRSNDRIT